MSPRKLSIQRGGTAVGARLARSLAVPASAYTDPALLSAVPVVETGKSGLRRERIVLEGFDVADPSNVPPGLER